MKRVVYITILLLLFVPVVNAQQLVFDHTEWFFGTIAEESGVVEHTFTAKNQSSSPALILDVIASCGCMKPEFKRQPVMPGGEIDVVLRFNPLGQQGAIERIVTVYGEQQQVIARLKIRGDVTPRYRSVEERFPYELASGIRLTNNHLNFAEVRVGETRCVTLGLINNSTKAHNIEFRPLSGNDMLRVNAPSNLQPGEESSVYLCFVLGEDERRYGSTQERFELYVDGKREHIVVTVKGVVVDGARSGEVDGKALLESNTLRLGELSLRRVGSAKCSVVLYNEGRRELLLRKIECPSSISCRQSGGERIPPHGELTLEFEFNPAGYDYGAVVESVRIITNDAKHPLMKLRISAIVVE